MSASTHKPIDFFYRMNVIDSLSLFAMPGWRAYNRGMDKINEANMVIDRIGGVTRVAELCEIKPQSVCLWRHHGIPQARRQYLLLAKPEAFKPPPQDEVKAA